MSYVGQCLVASPHLDDPNFFRSVVLIIAHSKEGCMGLILNRPTELSVKSVLESATHKPCVHEGFLHRGGPVDGPLMALHSVSILSDCECLPGVQFTSNGNHLTKLSTLTDISIKIFDGYAGWTAGQLEEEMDRGGWLLWQPNERTPYAESETLWKDCIHQIGADILKNNLANLKVPEDPRFN